MAASALVVSMLSLVVRLAAGVDSSSDRPWVIPSQGVGRSAGRHSSLSRLRAHRTETTHGSHRTALPGRIARHSYSRPSAGDLRRSMQHRSGPEKTWRMYGTKTSNAADHARTRRAVATLEGWRVSLRHSSCAAPLAKSRSQHGSGKRWHCATCAMPINPSAVTHRA